MTPSRSMMSRQLCGAAAAVVLVGALTLGASSAEASAVRDCGNVDLSIRNVTTRQVSCRDGRKFARSYGFVGYGNTTRHKGRYTCRTRTARDSYMVDVRCTHGSHVVRWQYSSGE